MPITLGSNIASLTAQRRLAEGTSQLAKTYEKLSSGLRINRASDDAAGLAIADSLRADSRILNQGVRNLNDGISLLNIADSAVENLSSIVMRLQELAEQAANGTYGATQRKALDAEAQALSKEFLRISKSTEFNGRNLLNGGTGTVSLQAGVGTGAILSAGVGGAIGTGTFTNAGTYLQEAGISYDAELFDLNGDGNLDLLTAGSDEVTGGFLTVRLGSGNGGFGAATSYVTEGNRSRSLAVGDINGDGNLDVVTGGFTGAADGYATVRLGRGDGTFGADRSYATESLYSFAVDLGDVDNDGDLDLVTAGTSDANDGYATVRLNGGDGTFGSAVSYAMESRWSTDMVLGDVNADGKLDIVTSGYSDALAGYMTVRLGQGNGTFGAGTSYVMDVSSSLAIAVADLNKDGYLDAVTGGYNAALEGSAYVRFGAADGTFGAATSYVFNGLVDGIALSDINGDGAEDLIAAAGNLTGGDLTIRLGNGNGTFGASFSYATSNRRSEELAVGDINNDGVLDIVTADSLIGTPAFDGGATVFKAVVTDGVNPIVPFSLKTVADARQALPIFRRKLDLLAAQRGQIGAFQSRIGVATNVLQVTSENFKAAESRIRDADIAAESSNLVRLNILQQAASSVLAQANQQPALALKLLQA